MADTQRSQNDLLTSLFPDGLTEGAITAQTIRDLIVSLLPSFGAMSITALAETTIGSAGVFVKAAGGTGVPSGFTPINFSSPAANRLMYTGTVPIHAFVSGSMSISAAGPADAIAIKVAKNGVVIDESMVQIDLGGTGEKSALSFHAGVDFVANDFVEMWVANLDDTTNATLENMFFHVQGGIL